LLRRLTAGGCRAADVHAIRTHCRRLQALSEFCGDDEQAAVMAENVSRLSTLRTLQVFQQYLAKIDAPQADRAVLRARTMKKIRALQRKHVFGRIEQAVKNHVLPALTGPGRSPKDRLELLCHEHVRNLEGLIEAVKEKPRRKRLHALRLRLKTVRYQTEWLPGRSASKQQVVKRIKKVQTLLGRYEELADFKRWGKELDRTVQARIQKDWKRVRKRARAVPADLAWLVETLASGRLWSEVGRT
jgi:CHAD domain-containing protein